MNKTKKKSKISKNKKNFVINKKQLIKLNRMKNKG